MKVLVYQIMEDFTGTKLYHREAIMIYFFCLIEVCICPSSLPQTGYNPTSHFKLE